MINIGILSDTHLTGSSSQFNAQCTEVFDGCEIIIHAGDLTDISVLSAFKEKEVHSVCGNSCNRITQMSLPNEKFIMVDGYKIAITHGTGPRHNIMDRVFEKFPDADCIIFGHTHLPVCEYYGTTLLINPGSFQNTGTYGSSGSYAILRISNQGLKATIHFLSEQT